MTAHAGGTGGGGGGGGAPTGPAGGDLTGTFPNPTVGLVKITTAKIADGAVTAAKVAADVATQAELDAEAAARVAADATLQPLDSDLTAIALLTTTTFGRSLLASVDAPALRTLAGLGTAATQATSAFDAAGAAAAAQAASQPVDSDLTAIASLTTTTFGRAFLALADATALRVAAGLVIGTDIPSLAALTAEASARTTADGLLAKGLILTALKTANYSPSVNEFVPVDATSGGITITLPTAPADKTRIGVKKIDSSTNLVTITRGGTDIFNKAGGSTSVALTYANQAVQVQYEVATGIWYAVSSDLGLTALDTRYSPFAEAATRAAADALLAPLASPSLTGSPTAPTQAANDNSTKVSTTAYVERASGLLVPRSSTVPSGANPYEYLDRPVLFNGVVDYKRHQGHNVKSTISTEPRYIISSEDKYYDGVDTWCEFYVELNYPSGETLEDGITVVPGGTTTTGSHTLPVATVNVVSTTIYPPEGKIVLNGGFHGEAGQLVSYTGKTATTFTGCSGGTGTIAAGTRISRFYSRPYYVQSLRNSGASDKHVHQFNLGSGGGNINVSAGPNRNVLTVDDVNRTFDLTNYSLRRNGTHVARLNVNAMGPASLPNLRAWNYDPLHSSSGAGFGAAGDVMMMQVPWPDADTIAGVQIYLTSGGTTLTANQCLAGIYSSGGVLLATSVDQATAWASSGLKNCALTTPTLIPAGTGANPCVYVAMFWNGSAQPSVLKGLNNPPLANGANVASDKRFSRGATGATTALPSTITMSARVDSTISSFWAGLSV